MKLYPIDCVTPLRDQAYYFYMMEAFEKATALIWAQVFSINLTYTNDELKRARSLVDALVAAHRRGVDVRLILGGEQTELNGFEMSNSLSMDYMTDQGLPAVCYHSERKYSAHSKYVMLDGKRIILGSHNWGHRSLRTGHDDSVEIASEGFCRFMAGQFLSDWEYSNKMQFVEAP